MVFLVTRYVVLTQNLPTVGMYLGVQETFEPNTASKLLVGLRTLLCFREALDCEFLHHSYPGQKVGMK